ncbi:nitroreductase [Azospirillum sp. YIM B02556]|uniref:Nitroreductase n=1 Tax=Azospirillum endophyticum TaxID=2800326 RepID=A0ABS1FER1_9PROT|nr:nitroreductase [Azospirillum endophyticum]MBK1841916.1 nitroreductase [Azospirillum endophyticum]
MDVLDAIYHRRAVRDFTGEAVDEATIRSLIDAAVQAPSAMNLQPWAFALLHGVDRLRAMSIHAKRHVAAHLPAGSPLTGHLADPQFDLFHGAATLVVICATDSHTQSAEDCCLAAQNLMLAAHARGLGSCWIGLSRPWLCLPEVKSKLGIPEHLIPVAPIILGHPRSLPVATPRREPRIVRCE